MIFILSLPKCFMKIFTISLQRIGIESYFRLDFATFWTTKRLDIACDSAFCPLGASTTTILWATKMYIDTNIKYCVNNLSKIKSSILKAKIYWFQVNLKVSSYPLKYVQCFLHKNWCVLECFNGKPETQSNISWILFNCKKSLQFYLP